MNDQSALIGLDSEDVLASMLRSDPETAFDYLEFRGILAGKCAAFAAQRATDADIAMIEKAFNEMVAAYHTGDPALSAQADAHFHLTTYVAAHNEMMLHVMKRLFGLLCEDAFFDHGELYQRVGVRDRFLRQHKAIYSAIAAHDPEAARIAADEHLASTAEAVREAQRAGRRLQTSIRRRHGMTLTTTGS